MTGLGEAAGVPRDERHRPVSAVPSSPCVSENIYHLLSQQLSSALVQPAAKGLSAITPPARIANSRGQRPGPAASHWRAQQVSAARRSLPVRKRGCGPGTSCFIITKPHQTISVGNPPKPATRELALTTWKDKVPIKKKKKKSI